jgi:hypothetical protein
MKSSQLDFRDYTGETDSLLGRHDLGMTPFIEPSSFCFIN